MFDRAACAKVRVAANAHVELAALTALAALLRQVLNDHLVSSNAPLSGVLEVSREPNRGELHATPDQAAAGAPPGAAADRPVRRRTAREDRKRARVVHIADGHPSRIDRADDTAAPEHADQNRIGSMTEAGHDL